MWEPGQGRARGVLPLSADINVTSLVDVAFTLLVIFIITAPILQGGVEVELPRAESGPLSQREGVIVTIGADGQLFLGETPMASREEFVQYFRDNYERQARPPVYLKGDRRVAYGEVMELLGLLREEGVEDVSFVLEAPARERPRR